MDMEYVLAAIVAFLILGLVGLVAAGLRLSVPRRMAQRRDVCASCGYSMTGLPPDSRCPECGCASPRVELDRPPTRLRELWSNEATPLNLLIPAAVVPAELLVMVLITLAICGSSGLWLTMGVVFGPSIGLHLFILVAACVRVGPGELLLLAFLPALCLIGAGTLLMADTMIWNLDAQGGITLLCGGILLSPASVGFGAGLAIALAAGCRAARRLVRTVAASEKPFIHQPTSEQPGM